jgi:hypothetical protein
MSVAAAPGQTCPVANDTTTDWNPIWLILASLAVAWVATIDAALYQTKRAGRNQMSMAA